MSNKTETIYKKLVELFSLTKTEEKFADAKLKDGSILHVEGDIIAGAKAAILSTDGTSTPAADGELEMEDGSKITIKGGVIEAITPAQAVIDPANPTAPVADPTQPVDEPMATDAPVADPTAPVAAPVNPDEAKEQSAMDLLTQTIAELTDRVAAIEAKLGDAVEANVTMAEQVAKFAKEAAAEPIKRKDVSEAFESTKVDKYINKIEELRSFRK